MDRNDRLESGYLDSEDSLLDEHGEPAVEMQNPLSDTLNRIRINSMNNPDHPHKFSDDDGSSAASSKVQLNAFGVGDAGAGAGSARAGAGAGSGRSSVDALCRASSECGSVMGTIQLPLRLSTATTPAVGDEEKVAEDTSPPSPAAGKRQAMMMEAVDFGSTNRIMKLREVNGSSSGRGNSAGSDGGGEVESVGECPTVEPSPETIMPGDAPSAGDELNEVKLMM